MPYTDTPFRKYLPRWAKITGILLLISGQYLITGLNGDISPRITSYFGLDSSKVAFYLQISTVGMIAMFPLAYRFRAFFRRINLLLIIMGVQLIICLLCIITYNETLLLTSSLLMGGLKIICILDFFSLVITVFPFLRKDRGLFYGALYAYLRIMREISSYLTLNLIDNYQWDAVYTVSAALAAVSILITLLLFPTSRLQRKIPLYQIDWISVLLIMTLGISLCYTLVMGREKNWFSANSIRYSSLIFILSSAFFIYRQLKVKRPLWNLRVFRLYKQIRIGFLLMLLLFFFQQSAILFTNYFDYNFSNEEHYLAYIALVKIGCYLFFFPLAGWLFYQGYSKRFLFSIGFLCYGLTLLYFSHSIQPYLVFSDLFIPLALGSIGYAFTLTTAAAFMSTNVARKDNRGRIMGSVFSRYVLGTYIGYSLYTNWLFRQTQHNKLKLAEHINITNLSFTQQFKGISTVFSSKNTDIKYAKNQALSIIQERVNTQAMLVTIRNITFIVGVLAVLAAISILFLKKVETKKVKGKNRYRIIPR